ncbi:hypothetical protein Y1Q_0003918 [Alligator mississippiensis]|uniref:Uncharacterized protein n=1 Tax=Alligator mississippiensis TaxID=8496 RepID=A0A151MNP8_ALLMI|nr:hypothetical protein Y1Q_0003918 [Alligator mississippiensis]
MGRLRVTKQLKGGLRPVVPRRDLPSTEQMNSEEMERKEFFQKSIGPLCCVSCMLHHKEVKFNFHKLS